MVNSEYRIQTKDQAVSELARLDGWIDRVSCSVRPSAPHEPPPSLAAPAFHGGGPRAGGRIGRMDRGATDVPRCVSALGHSDDLCRPTLWRHGPGADGGLPDLLLRVLFSLHHRDRARGVE